MNNKISQLRSKRRKLLSEDENNELINTLCNLNELLESYKPNGRFDEDLFEKIVTEITAECNETLTFKLIGGIELTEAVSLKGRCNRCENS